MKEFSNWAVSALWAMSCITLEYPRPGTPYIQEASYKLSLFIWHSQVEMTSANIDRNCKITAQCEMILQAAIRCFGQ